MQSYLRDQLILSDQLKMLQTIKDQLNTITYQLNTITTCLDKKLGFIDITDLTDLNQSGDENQSGSDDESGGDDESDRTYDNGGSLKQIYFIHDNGGFPFKVVIYGNGLDIFTYSGTLNGEFDDDDDDKNYNTLVKSYRNLTEIFIPKGIDEEGELSPDLEGNNILAHISEHKYVMIGSCIYEFETKNEKILEFHSQVGNNDVPYPLAVGENNVYFLIGCGGEGYLPKKYFRRFPLKYRWEVDGYSVLWGHYSFKKNGTKTKKTKTIPNIEIKINER